MRKGSMDSVCALISRKEHLRSLTDLCDVRLTLPPIPSCNLDIVFCDDEVPQPTTIQNGCIFPLCVGDVFQAPVTGAFYMTSGDDVKKVISVIINTENSSVQFAAGDTVAILPCNSDRVVEEFSNRLNVKDHLFKKCIINQQEQKSKKKSPLMHIPCCSTLFHILKTCVDIRFIPKKVLLRILAEYTSDECEKRCLEELSSKEKSALYNSVVLECGTTIQDILSAFSSCQPPIERLLEFLPRLTPRPYSIASSPLVSPNSVRIVLSVVEFPVKGLCSGWLHELVEPFLKVPNNSIEKKMENLSMKTQEPYIEVPMFFRKSANFNLPEDTSVPLILIGPGTGVAPFIGFLQNRAAQKEKMPHATFGDVWLFYGCRYAERDFLFRREIEQFISNGVISQFFVSFSRDIGQENGVKYVQDNIKKHSKSFVHMVLEERSMVYVCGDGNKMAKDVWESIAYVLSSETNLSESDAFSHLIKMQKDGKYRQDVWV